MNQEEIIINEAIRQFADKGLRFTVQDVAENLHMAKKTIYHSFSTKEDLLIAMLRKGFSSIQENKRQILSSDEELPVKLKNVNSSCCWGALSTGGSGGGNSLCGAGLEKLKSLAG